METVFSGLSWVTGAVLGLPGAQVLWITVEFAINSKRSFVPCAHIKRQRACRSLQAVQERANS